ncbi:uncharacterized protein F4822DRAFT_434848 [Hypoxylon trugodes]|uniref:uncharacterized protein n=1 Tax=Hypoxylon trugodes TaxID=326681 RepID=UPI00218CDEE4|nr:uncharacterized protein F4822DRAFT_434848 [Hypoxylon trugodes]KAI1382918.1 hypothetical protein F4822DRAFT_434848 [Hypoxylon trugodes]
MPRILKNFKVGYTIALFYPTFHYFLGGTVGVRVEDSHSVMEVLEMNKEVIKYTPTEGAKQKCYSCDETKDNLNMCAGCKTFHYCNKDCQTKAWKGKGHKKVCRVLKDDNVKKIRFLNYGVFDGGVTFR